MMVRIILQDACSALNVMLFLKGMATQQGATLLASIHQPRSVIWSQLDQVIMLALAAMLHVCFVSGVYHAASMNTAPCGSYFQLV